MQTQTQNKSLSAGQAALLVVALTVGGFLVFASIVIGVAALAKSMTPPAVVRNDPPAPQAVDADPVKFGMGDRVLFRHGDHKCSGVVQERYGDDVRVMAHGSEQWIDAADVIRVLPSHKPAPPPQGSPTGSTGSAGASK